ncbi:MAG: MarR family transcriptional regulator, partial [Sciscionella sp.]
MGTEVATSTESQQLVEEVLAATQTLVAMSTQSLGDLAHEVSAAQYRALDALAVHGRLQMAELAQLLGVRPSTAGRMCDRLVARRLVGRRRAPQDRRIVMVALSSNGRRVVEAASEHRRA